MKPYGLNELREKFLAFFESKDHLRLPSFSLVPKNDASLLLINSGMAPMKPWFTGEQEPPRKRVTTCQKCIRTGDIENIGKTARHGTYFEMLGNFSFGDYFKREAIAWSWEFFTVTLGLDPTRLYPSVYEKDDEAFEIWNKQIGIPAERIFRFGKADNFWEHGTGPCGPCSEIYYDRGEKYGCGSPDCTVGCECDRYIEVWNNVFTQFDNDGNGNYTELAQKNIDTGMGLERLAMVCQDVNSLFDVDTVMNITAKVTEITGAAYGQSAKTDVSLRVITDHIRSGTMMICDGVLPSNEGRGYVLRRLLRRAARHGKLLGVNRPFLFDVCATVIEENREAYPDLPEKQGYITRVIRAEEENFAKTIDGGMAILSGILEQCKSEGKTEFPGADAFKLYDTYGFPVDLTIELLDEAGLTLDRAGFDALMTEQRQRARAARAASAESSWASSDLAQGAPPTEFIGYTETEAPAAILALAAGGEACNLLSEGDEGAVILDKTPFYAEMGGQAADHGTISCDSGVFTVIDVQKAPSGKYIHRGTVASGELRTGDTVTAAIDLPRRAAIMRAHCATHLLHKALRDVLGDHVHQAGSLVEPDKLRFDFTHFSALTAEELSRTANLVNAAILAGHSVAVEEMNIDAARAKGAMALFGEKYGDTVRVVDMGAGHSVELCGGTHLDNTAKTGLFHIQSEASIASGVRRIEATVGEISLHVMNQNQRLLLEVSSLLKTSPVELRGKLDAHLHEARELRNRLEGLEARQAVGQAEGYLLSARDVGGVKLITAKVGDVNADALRRMGDFLRDKAEDMAAVLCALSGEKITFFAACGKGAIAKGIRAGDLVKHVCTLCGGSGGGKPDSAMGGGKDATQVDAALASVQEFVRTKLG